MEHADPETGIPDQDLAFVCFITKALTASESEAE